MDQRLACIITRPQTRVTSNNGIDMADLIPGAKAPEFNLPLAGDGQVGSASLNGRAFAVFFFPRADSPACTTEAVEFSRLAPEFRRLNVGLVGISPDSPTKLGRFRDKHAIDVDLASDQDLGVINAWGAWVEKSMYGRSFMGVERATFLIDATGRIAAGWRRVRVAGHADAVLAAAARLVG